MSIGSRIKQIRKEVDMTQSQFADSIGMKQSPLSQIESDKILPSIETLRIIRRKFNISYNFIIEGQHSKTLLPTVSDEGVNEAFQKIGINSQSLISQLITMINKYKGEEGANPELQLNSIYELEHFVQNIIDDRIGKLEGLIQKLLSTVDEKVFEEDLKQEIEKSNQRLQDNPMNS